MQVRMRTLVPMLLLALALPAGALAVSWQAPTDGTLGVRDGRGTITIVVRGSIIGRLGRGEIQVTDLTPNDRREPIVRGADRIRWPRNGNPIYGGRDLRFRLIDGRYRVRIQGAGIALSAVGRGRFMLDGGGTDARGIPYDGLYSLNGEPFESLPDEATQFELIGPPPEE